MWTCPECGRQFRNVNQSHYCGPKPRTVDEYIARQEADKQADLNLVRNVLREALPEADERISWSMPTYWEGHNILHFAAARNHIGLYPGPEAVAHFQPDLQGYKTDKGTIRIPYGKVDADLIRRIAQWCGATGSHA